MEETRVPGENHRPVASHFFVIHKAGGEPMPYWLIGVYELLGNPTTQLTEPPRPYNYLIH